MAEAGVRAVFAASVRRERRARHWTQRELARKAGISPATVLNIELGHSSPTLDVMALIAGAFGMSVGALADGEAARG